MSDVRWGDPREYGERDRDDGRPRVYDERDRDDHDPRDGLMHDLDLPRGEERELVVDRDCAYELKGEDSVHRLLEGKANKSVTLKVGPKADGTDSREVSLLAAAALIVLGLGCLVIPPRGDIPMSDPAPMDIRFPGRRAR